MTGKRWYLIHGTHRTTVAELSLRIPLRIVKAAARVIANSIKARVEIMSGTPSDARLRVHNPTLVHHGLAQRAYWHIWTDTGNGHLTAVADLYKSGEGVARQIAQMYADGLHVPVKLSRNEGDSFARHDREATTFLRGRTPNRRKRRNARGRKSTRGVIANFGRFSFTIPIEAAQDMTGPGPADEAVEHWAKRIVRPASITPALLAAELKEYGAWDASQLADDDENWRRIVWIGAHDIIEGNPRGDRMRRMMVATLLDKTLRAGSDAMAKRGPHGPQLLKSRDQLAAYLDHRGRFSWKAFNHLAQVAGPGFMGLGQVRNPSRSKRARARRQTRRQDLISRRVRRSYASGRKGKSRYYATEAAARHYRRRVRGNPGDGVSLELYRLNNGVMVAGTDDGKGARHWLIRAQAEKFRRTLLNDGNYAIYKPAGGRMFYLRYEGPIDNPSRSLRARHQRKARRQAPRSLKGSGSRRTRRALAAGRTAEAHHHQMSTLDRGRFRRNPSIRPVKGEVWTTGAGKRCKILSATSSRVHILHMESGNREWIDMPEFLASYRPLRRNPRPPRSRSQVKRGLKTFRKWHEFGAHKISRVAGPPRTIPKTVVKLGELRSIVYDSDKYAGGPDNPKGEVITYEHTTKRPRPLLVTDPAGRHVHIVGGKMKVTRDGLVN